MANLRSKKGQSQKVGYFVYKIISKNDEIAYVGKTHNMIERMNKHRQVKYAVVPPKDVKKIEYVSLGNECDMAILEAYMIDLYKPKYNTDLK